MMLLYEMLELTVDLEVDGPVEFGFGVDLAFVVAGVAGLGGGDAKLPVVVGDDVVDAETYVAGVADGGVRQYVQVPLSDPR